MIFAIKSNIIKSSGKFRKFVLTKIKSKCLKKQY